MADVLEYYLTGGKLRIGKKEMTLEILRNDSILRMLLGFEAGNLSSLKSHVNLAEQGDYVILDFNGREMRKLSDPAPLLNELKARYGGTVGGMLSFNCIYTTYVQISYYYADLDADPIVLKGGA